MCKIHSPRHEEQMRYGDPGWNGSAMIILQVAFSVAIMILQFISQLIEFFSEKGVVYPCRKQNTDNSLITEV